MLCYGMLCMYVCMYGMYGLYGMYGMYGMVRGGLVWFGPRFGLVWHVCMTINTNTYTHM